MAIDEVQYSKLGTLFVILCLAALVAGLLWMGG